MLVVEMKLWNNAWITNSSTNLQLELGDNGVMIGYIGL